MTSTPDHSTTEALNEAVTALRDLYGLIERNELVRNPSADGKADYLSRIVEFFGILKRAQQVLDKPWAQGHQSSPKGAT